MGYTEDLLAQFLGAAKMGAGAVEGHQTREAKQASDLEAFLRGQQEKEGDRAYQEGRDAKYRDFQLGRDKSSHEKALELERLRGSNRLTETREELKSKDAKEQAKRAPVPLQDRLKGMKSFDKTRYAFYSEGLKEVNKMMEHLDKGGGRYAGVGGDNPYTLSLSKIYNAIARPETGAAIPKHERDDYLSQLRSMMDSPEMSRNKLTEIRNKMMANVSIAGVEPEEIPGYTPYQFQSEAPGILQGVGRDLKSLITPYKAPKVTAPSAPKTPDLDSMSLEELKAYEESL